MREGDFAEPGQRLSRFTLTEQLGDGVWAAHDPELDRDVVVKLVDGARGEAQAMARLTHANVVRIYELGADAGRAFCAMERVDGVTLREWLAAPRSWREVLAVALAAARGLAAIHAAGLAHGALTADSVLIARDGRVLVSDFGLARGARDDQLALCELVQEPLAGAPAAVVRCIRRGLAGDPEARWPSLDALIAALERAVAGRRRRRRLALAVAAFAAAAAIASAAWLRRDGDPEADVRAAGESRMARVWNPVQAIELRAAFARTGDPVVAREASDIVIAELDRYRAAWLAARHAAWRASVIDEQTAPEALEQQLACFDRLAGELGAFAHLASAAATAPAMHRAVHGVRGITPVGTCSDPAQIASIVEVAGGGPVPAELYRIEVEHARLRAMLLAGRPDAAVALARTLVEQTERVGAPGLLAQLLLLLATAENDAGDYAAAERTLRRLILVAAQVRRHRLVADAWIRLVNLLGNRLRRHDESVALEPAARAAVALAGDDPFQRADLAAMLGSIEYARGHSRVARDRFREAFEGFVAARGPGSAMAADAERVYALTLDAVGERDQAMRHAEHAYQTMRTLHGEHDPIVGKQLAALSGLALQHDDAAAAVKYGDKAVAILSAIYGADHLETALARSHLAFAFSAAGRHAEAIDQLTRSEATLRRVLGPGHPDVLQTELELGSVLETAGRLDEAERIERRAVTGMRDRLPANHPDLGYAIAELARVAGLRTPAEGLLLYDEALGIIAALPDRDPADDVPILEHLADTALRARRPGAALAWFARLPDAAHKLAALEARLRGRGAR